MSAPLQLPACPRCGSPTSLAAPNALAQPGPRLAVACSACGTTTLLDAEVSAEIRRAADAIVRNAVDLLQQWARVVQLARQQIAAGIASPELIAAVDHLDAYWADPAASTEARRDAIDRVLKALAPPEQEPRNPEP